MLWKYVCVSCVLKKFDKIDKSPNIGIGLKKSAVILYVLAILDLIMNVFLYFLINCNKMSIFYLTLNFCILLIEVSGAMTKTKLASNKCSESFSPEFISV